MSPFFDDLEAQLLAAARAQTAGERAPVEPQGGIDWRGWVAVVLRSVPIGLAVLCAVAIAVLAVVLVHHGRRGPVGRTRTRRSARRWRSSTAPRRRSPAATRPAWSRSQISATRAVDRA